MPWVLTHQFLEQGKLTIWWLFYILDLLHKEAQLIQMERIQAYVKSPHLIYLLSCLPWDYTLHDFGAYAQPLFVWASAWYTALRFGLFHELVQRFVSRIQTNSQLFRLNQWFVLLEGKIFDNIDKLIHKNSFHAIIRVQIAIT